jgi:hypothetical protein
MHLLAAGCGLGLFDRLGQAPGKDEVAVRQPRRGSIRKCRGGPCERALMMWPSRSSPPPAAQTQSVTSTGFGDRSLSVAAFR